MKLLGQEDASLADVVSEATSFMAACYGSKCDGSMSDVRFMAWSTKMANPKISSAPQLKTLPPTSSAFTQQVYRAHYQTIIWKLSLSRAPCSSDDPIHFGWSKLDDQLYSTMLPEDILPVPVEVLQMIKCGCASAAKCSTGRCSCVVAQMSCSMFCNCHAEPECDNIHTQNRPISPQDELDDN